MLYLFLILFLTLHIIQPISCNIGILYLQVQKMKGVHLLKFHQIHSIKIDNESLKIINQIKISEQVSKSMQVPLPQIKMQFRQNEIKNMIKINFPMRDQSAPNLQTKYDLFFHVTPIYSNKKYHHLSNQIFCLFLSASPQSQNILNCLRCNIIQGELEKLTVFTIENNIMTCLKINKQTNRKLNQFIKKSKPSLIPNNQKKQNHFKTFVSLICKVSFIVVLLFILAMKYRMENQNQLQPI